MTLTTELTGLDYSVYMPAQPNGVRYVFHGRVRLLDACIWQTVYSNGTSDSMLAGGDAFTWARYQASRQPKATSV